MRYNRLRGSTTYATKRRKEDPPPYPTYFGITTPPDMSPSMAYLSPELGRMHNYMTRTFFSIDTLLNRRVIAFAALRDIFYPPGQRDDRASSSLVKCHLIRRSA
ncbi:hypothetical protein Scep_019380 [Stephania cephalantha]|uniref:Uncharacterized protein n=1 Tax=Stephania cephalantha TaxID=152367 RepID=A0AAP0IAK2_9MAGN